MRSNLSHLHTRILRAGLRVAPALRYRVVAVGLDHRSRLIGLSTNTPRLLSRGWHAEERLIHRSPRTLARILIARIGRSGAFLPIDPCEHCLKLASKRGILIERWRA